MAAIKAHERILMLAVLVGIAIAGLANYQQWAAIPRFLLAAAALIGVAWVVSFATDQVGEHLAVHGLHLGPVRHRDDQIGAVAPAAVRALALLSVAGPADRTAVEVEQGRRARVHLEDHVTAVAAVTPVRAAERLELLAVNRGAAVPTVASLHLQRDPVGELRHNAHLPDA